MSRIHNSLFSDENLRLQGGRITEWFIDAALLMSPNYFMYLSLWLKQDLLCSQGSAVSMEVVSCVGLYPITL